MCEASSAGGTLEARWRHAGGTLEVCGGIGRWRYAGISSAGGALKVCGEIERWRHAEGMCEASSIRGTPEGR